MHKNAPSRPINTVTRADSVHVGRNQTCYTEALAALAPKARRCTPLCLQRHPAQSGPPIAIATLSTPLAVTSPLLRLRSVWVNLFRPAFTSPAAGRSVTTASPHCASLDCRRVVSLDVSEQCKDFSDHKKFKDGFTQSAFPTWINGLNFRRNAECLWRLRQSLMTGVNFSDLRTAADKIRGLGR